MIIMTVLYIALLFGFCYATWEREKALNELSELRREVWRLEDMNRDMRACLSHYSEVAEKEMS